LIEPISIWHLLSLFQLYPFSSHSSFCLFSTPLESVVVHFFFLFLFQSHFELLFTHSIHLIFCFVRRKDSPQQFSKFA
jgi:hypothetical protein